MQVSNKTSVANQKHHGTGEVSDLILKKRIENGWTEEEIQADCKPLSWLRPSDEYDLDDEEAYKADFQSRKMAARIARARRYRWAQPTQH